VLLESETARKAFAGALANSVLERAPYLVVPCRIARAFSKTEFLTASLGAAVENFLVALSAEGIGSAWVTADSGSISGLLDLPDDWEPLGVIAIGKPAEAPTMRSPRDPEDFISVR
jgi:coenzyme F420-0:L-glutamate ligase/coenzyme F420-1:gamma-L-glutamate ligase